MGHWFAYSLSHGHIIWACSCVGLRVGFLTDLGHTQPHAATHGVPLRGTYVKRQHAATRRHTQKKFVMLNFSCVFATGFQHAVNTQGPAGPLRATQEHIRARKSTQEHVGPLKGWNSRGSHAFYGVLPARVSCGRESERGACDSLLKSILIL